MTQYNNEVEMYISKSAAFAKPILNHIRQIIHDTCPEVEESIKWGIPHYSYKDDYLCMMGGFKKHCSFSLYKAELMKDKDIQESVKAGKNFGYMDKIKAIAELPSKKILIAYLKEAMAINETGVKIVKPKSDTPRIIEMPDYFQKELYKNAKVKTIFESKSPSFRKNYLIWIIDAKTEETRQKRITQSLEWILEGKDRFWQSKKVKVKTG